MNAADYYDKFAGPPSGDVEFYAARVTPNSRVLELGCGTGRVLVALAEQAAYVFGLDHSSAMLAMAAQKLVVARLNSDRAVVEAGDITDFDLTTRTPPFDLIIAPFRVMQNLESDEQIARLMGCIARHLAPGGQAILNTFCPRGGPEEIKAFWESRDGSQPTWSHPDGEETVSMTDVCTRYRDEPLIVYPELTYRRSNAAGIQLDEATLKIAMRVWYPDELIAMIKSHGFEISARFGGYEGEPWGEGSELVVAFESAGVEIRPMEGEQIVGA